MSAEAFAIRIATAETTRSAAFLRHDSYGEPDAALTCAFYCWLVRTAGQVILVDTGFGPDEARRRGLTILADVADGLRAAGTSPAGVDMVILSHLHFDHCGDLDAFRSARLVLQRAEYEFWSSALARRAQFASVFDAGCLDALDAARREGRLLLLDGDTELAPGLDAILLHGHTPGTQGVVLSAGGARLAFVSDAMHFYEQLELDNPAMVTSDVAAAYESFDRIRELRSRGLTLIPGHDVAVAERFHARPVGALGGLLIDLGRPV